MNIAEALKKIVEKNAEIYCKICQVEKIDKQAHTIDVIPVDDSAPILGVKLQAQESIKNGIVAIPKIDSFVVVAFLNTAEAVVVLFSDIDKFLLSVGDKPIEIMAESDFLQIKTEKAKIEIKEDKILFNDGENGGLVKIEALEENIEVLKKYCEDLKSAVSAGLKGVGASTAANGALGAQVFDAQMLASSINIKDMENKVIKH